MGDNIFQQKGVMFKSRIMNASGPLCTTETELESIGKSGSGAIVIKTATFEPRRGNEPPKYFEDSLGSINSNGLENLGYKKYCEIIPRLKKFQKPVIMSLLGFNLDEFEQMVKEADKAGADVIEANLSCPNLPGKPQVAYDFEQSDKYLSRLRASTDKPLWIKLPPYLEVVHRKEMAALLLKNKIDGATLINSVGNSLIVDIEKEQTVIKPNSGLGGVGGKYAKPLALGNVHTFFQELGDKIPIIGAGGIYSGTDAFEFFLCGARILQVGTAYKSRGPGVFEQIGKELKSILDKKGYLEVDDAVGKLKIVQGEDYGFHA